ncbi:MAG TPA: phosphoribulokinase, partial [Chromatiaceae bacterium]|nr:phosphoribulokinase [Chromatiaceae bacterium]
MSTKYPVVAVTGSSGAGTTTVKRAFEHIFERQNINPVVVEGDSFHRYDRIEMRGMMSKALEDGAHFSHFGPAANHFDKIEELFRVYGETGGGQKRYYLHSEEEAEPYGQQPGEFTPWEDIPTRTDLLFYEGLHGGA